MLPKDPMILLSLINTKLRDEFRDLDHLCEALDIDREVLEQKLEKAGFHYDEACNAFR